MTYQDRINAEYMKIVRGNSKFDDASMQEAIARVDKAPWDSDLWFFRAAVLGLIAVVLIAVIVAGFTTNASITGGIIAIGASAAGALVGIFATQKN